MSLSSGRKNEDVEDHDPSFQEQKPKKRNGTTTSSFQISSNNHSRTVIDECQEDLREMVAARDWEQFHTPRNLLLAMTGEVGEVAEIFQWKGEVSPGCPELSEEERQHLREEMADVFAYFLRLADVCEIDIYQAFKSKMEKNRKKYPPELCRGSAAKYTKYAKAVAAADA